MDSPDESSQMDTLAARIRTLETGTRFFSIGPKEQSGKAQI
jgi:hypothetical protein